MRLREGQLWAYRCCKYRGVRTVVHTRQMYREFLYHRHFKLFYLIELFKGGTPSWYVPRDVGTSSERTGRKVVALGMVQFLWRRPRFVQKEKKKNVYIRFCCLFCRKSQLLELTTLSRSEYRYLCRGEGGPFRRVPLYLCKNVSSRKPRPVANFAASSIAGVSPSPLLKQVFLRCVLHIYKASIDRSWDERASFDDGAFVGSVKRTVHRMCTLTFVFPPLGNSVLKTFYWSPRE